MNLTNLYFTNSFTKHYFPEIQVFTKAIYRISPTPVKIPGVLFLHDKIILIPITKIYIEKQEQS